jgi:hypothetical protein
MSRAPVRFLFTILLLAGLAAPGRASEPQRVRAASPAEARVWQQRIDGLTATGALLLARVRADTLMPERRHVRYRQLHRGVPVIGGDLVAQV